LKSQHDWNGARATISVDGGHSTTVDQSVGQVKDEPTREDILFSQTGLDGSQSHAIQIAYAGAGASNGVYFTVNGFMYVALATSISLYLTPHGCLQFR
jgi:hypothetical protein